MRSCLDCPARGALGKMEMCKHPETSGTILKRPLPATPPDWCALRSAPLLLWFASLGASKPAPLGTCDLQFGGEEPHRENSHGFEGVAFECRRWRPLP